jgi:hypothetical protein
MKHLISVPSNTIPYFHQISGLPEANWFVTSDPEGKRVGSGGGTAYFIRSRKKILTTGCKKRGKLLSTPVVKAVVCRHTHQLERVCYQCQYSAGHVDSN